MITRAVETQGQLMSGDFWHRKGCLISSHNVERDVATLKSLCQGSRHCGGRLVTVVSSAGPAGASVFLGCSATNAWSMMAKKAGQVTGGVDVHRWTHHVAVIDR
jgi:hypothetical protein